MSHAVHPDATSLTPVRKRLSGDTAHLAANTATSLARAAPDAIEAEIEAAVQNLGRFLRAESVALCALRGDESLGAHIEWRSIGWMYPSFSLDTSRAAWWRERQRCGEDIAVEDARGLSDLAPYEAQALGARGVRGLAAVPFGDRDTEQGYLVAETFREPRVWRPEDLGLMSAVADSITAALARRHHHERLLATAREAEKTSSARSTFIAMLAHELRTPLTAISGYARVLEVHLPEDANPEAAACVRDISECAGHIASLITDTLDLARIDSGALSLDLADVDVGEAVEGALAAVRPRARTDEIEIEWRPPAAPVRARADARRLRQLVINLLANAIAHSPTGARVVVTLEGDDARYAIAVEDQGAGIPARDRERVFGAFERGPERASDAPDDGLGLGLSLVSRLCELHGGRVDLDSEVGRGTRVTARLPLRPKPELHRSPHVVSPPPPAE